jgi:hypothetical protein
MVDFNQKAARKFCRYTRCRMKLPEPTTNLHEAFCKRGCYDSFHLKLCRVCEKPLEQKYRKVKPKKEGDAVKFVKVDNPGPTCGAAKCKRAWRDKSAMGRYSVPKGQIRPSGHPGTQESHLHQEVPAARDVLSEVRSPDLLPRWHIVAGGPLTPSQFHAATVPDGELVDGVPTWEGGSYERIEAQNRRLLERHFAKLEAEACERDAAASLNHCSACGREDDLTDRANPTLCYQCFSARKVAQLVTRPDLAIPYDLSIPAFLDRRLLPLQRAA